MEQASGVDQVNKALSQMDEVTQQNSALVEENAATAKTLEQSAHAMDERVAYFKIDDGDAKAIAPAAAPHKPAAERKAAPVGAPKRAAPAARRGGPVGRMQSALATALAHDEEMEEF
jgi:methyl-accepting chemotaxis protein